MIPRLGALDVEVRRLEELEQDVLDVLADVAGLGQGGRVGDGERHVEHPRERLGEERLAAARGAEQEDVGLVELDVVVLRLAGLDALVVVVDRDRQDLLRVVLPDDVVVQELEDLLRLRQLVERDVGAARASSSAMMSLHRSMHSSQMYTPGPGDELLDLLLGLRAEAALDEVAALTELRHVPILRVGSLPRKP